MSNKERKKKNNVVICTRCLILLSKNEGYKTAHISLCALVKVQHFRFKVKYMQSHQDSSLNLRIKGH